MAKKTSTIHQNPVMVWDRDRAQCLRVATKKEIQHHYQILTRDELPLDGEELGFPGRRLWLARLDPRLTILGWTTDPWPIYQGWSYAGRIYSRRRVKKHLFTDSQALLFARVLGSCKDRHGRVPGTILGLDEGRVLVEYKQDWGIAPQPLLDAWRASYWRPDGSISPASASSIATKLSAP